MSGQEAKRAPLQYWLVVQDHGEITMGEPGTIEQAMAAKYAHVKALEAQGFVFEDTTGLWVQYDDANGADDWREVYVEDSIGNHWFVGPELDLP